MRAHAILTLPHHLVKNETIDSSTANHIQSILVMFVSHVVLTEKSMIYYLFRVLLRVI